MARQMGTPYHRLACNNGVAWGIRQIVAENHAQSAEYQGGPLRTIIAANGPGNWK